MVTFRYNATGVETPMDEVLAKKLSALNIGSIVNSKAVKKTVKSKPKKKSK